MSPLFAVVGDIVKEIQRLFLELSYLLLDCEWTAYTRIIWYQPIQT